MPGFGSLVGGSTHSVHAVLVPLRAMMAVHGMVHMDNLGDVLSEKGVTAEDITMAAIAPGQVIWRPYGFAPVLRGLSYINYCKAVPWVHASFRNTLDEEVIDMVCACTLVAAKAAWKDMIGEMQSFFKE